MELCLDKLQQTSVHFGCVDSQKRGNGEDFSRTPAQDIVTNVEIELDRIALLLEDAPDSSQMCCANNDRLDVVEILIQLCVKLGRIYVIRLGIPLAASRRALAFRRGG